MVTSTTHHTTPKKRGRATAASAISGAATATGLSLPSGNKLTSHGVDTAATEPGHLTVRRRVRDVPPAPRAFVALRAGHAGSQLPLGPGDLDRRGDEQHGQIADMSEQEVGQCAGGPDLDVRAERAADFLLLTCHF